ncbi:hypothetical protein BJ170DRAFT_714582 [Xylariales sp. AK1849]|nr:hypothetical protein BJ170DRAFT_714582 [Xylariales sp. AK1849]
MRGLFGLAIATLATLITTSLAIPIVVQPGNEEDLIITAENAMNGTHVEDPVFSSNPLSISIINNLSSSSSLNAYVTGLDTNNAVVFLSPSGSWYYPDPSGATTPVLVKADIALTLNGYGETTEFTLPDYISSARVWVAEGSLSFYTVEAEGATQLVEPSFANPSDPSAAVNWGFVELTNNSGGIYANLSFVDFVGLVMGMSLTLGSGEVQKVQGLKQGAVSSICSDLKSQTAVDGQPWDKMCVTDTSGNPLRVLAPNIYMDINTGAMEDYWDDYVDQVWAKYTSQNLTIDTQSGAGSIGCRVVNDALTCAGDNRAYAQPSAKDIFGCNSGPFGFRDGDNDIHHSVVPRLCAAFTRGTLLAYGGDVQPLLGSDSYYLTGPNNQYSRIVHKYETDGRGYAFSYDDVNPDGQNEAGVVSGADPRMLQIIVGGFP